MFQSRDAVLAALALAMASPVGAATSDKECPSGKLIKVRTEERSQAIAPPTQEDAPRGEPAARSPGRFYYLTLQCGDARYVARFLDGGDFSPEDLKTGGAVRFRVKGDKLYLKGPHGQEIEGLFAVVKPQVGQRTGGGSPR
jgi:hypothetical protein